MPPSPRLEIEPLVPSPAATGGGSSGPKHGRLPRYVLTLGAGVIYALAAEFGFQLAFATEQVTAIWPPTGIAVVSLLRLGPGCWPGIFLGAFVVNAGRHEPLFTAFGIAVGNTLGPLCAARWLRAELGAGQAVDRVRSALALLGAAMVSMGLTASCGVTNLALAHIVPWHAYFDVWWVWWLGDTLGVVVLAPFLLAMSAKPQTRAPASRFECALLIGLLALISQLGLSGAWLEASSRIEYAVFPCVIWAALRCGPRVASSSILVISGFALWGAIAGVGPFGTGSLDRRLILLDLFLAVSAATGMVLSARTSEVMSAQEALRAARDELERRVAERTTALAGANQTLRETNEALARRTLELGLKNEEVEAFVYIVSHDLRAPLVNLQGFSNELQLSCAELERAVASRDEALMAKSRIAGVFEDIHSALRYVSASATKFQRLIDALLVLSRTGRQDLRHERVDMQALVQSTLDTLEHAITQSGARVTMSPLPPALGDATGIGQVFSNLIGNAAKYSRTDTPSLIEVGGEKLDSGLSHYWVRDNGMGIPDAAKSRIFQVFQRFHPERAAGEGMGLAIVKRVVERHGGRVWVESRVGVGSTFHLTLPTADAAEVAACL